MSSNLYPRKWIHSIYTDIDFEKLYKAGYRGIISDIDNTLVEHDADASEEAVKLCKKLKDIGFQLCLMSNNDEERVSRFNQDINVHMIYNAKKPLLSSYNKAMELMGTNKKNTVFFGDQIFTDIYGANRAGIKSILVDPISPKEEIQIIIKRFFEKLVLFFYKRRITKQKKKKKNIVFIGFMASGKTTIGKALAEKKGYYFIDTDKWISNKMNAPISEIFDNKGEDYFRQLETNTIKKLSKSLDNTIISTGGGLSIKKENVPYLKNMGTVVFLKVSKETVISRLGKNKERPLLASENPEEKIETLLKERNPIYEQVADVIIDTNNKSIKEIADEVIKTLRGRE